MPSAGDGSADDENIAGQWLDEFAQFLELSPLSAAFEHQ